MTKTKKAKGEHYVENKVFLQAMTDWKAECKLAEEEQKDLPEEDRVRPQVNNYIGECFLKIATHLSYRPNFINYTYRDEMISDGIENCLQYCGNFDPEKSIASLPIFVNKVLSTIPLLKSESKASPKVKACRWFMTPSASPHMRARSIVSARWGHLSPSAMLRVQFRRLMPACSRKRARSSLRGQR